MDVGGARLHGLTQQDVEVEHSRDIGASPGGLDARARAAAWLEKTTKPGASTQVNAIRLFRDVRAGRLPKDLELTHVNLNDQTVEGMRHKKLSVFSVQYHPEAAPGPLDASHLFRRFRERVLAQG